MSDPWIELSDVMEDLTRIIEAAYRAQAEAAGFSPTVAEQMAVDFRQMLLGTVSRK